MAGHVPDCPDTNPIELECLEVIEVACNEVVRRAERSVIADAEEEGFFAVNGEGRPIDAEDGVRSGFREDDFYRSAID